MFVGHFRSEDVELMVLHENELTGGVVVLRKFHSGVTVPTHTHPLTNEFVYVLSAREESGVRPSGEIPVDSKRVAALAKVMRGFEGRV